MINIYYVRQTYYCIYDKHIINDKHITVYNKHIIMYDKPVIVRQELH